MHKKYVLSQNLILSVFLSFLVVFKLIQSTAIKFIKQIIISSDTHDTYHSLRRISGVFLCHFTNSLSVSKINDRRTDKRCLQDASRLKTHYLCHLETTRHEKWMTSLFFLSVLISLSPYFRSQRHQSKGRCTRESLTSWFFAGILLQCKNL